MIKRRRAIIGFRRRRSPARTWSVQQRRRAGITGAAPTAPAPAPPPPPDDLIIFRDGQANPPLLGKIWKVVSCFGQFSGLKVKLNKTAAIVRNCAGMEWAKCFGDIGVDVKNFVKYLAVGLGNIRHHQDDQGCGLPIEQVFASTLQEAFRRARVVSTLQLSMDERALMMTSWILPVVAWVSKA